MMDQFIGQIRKLDSFRRGLSDPAELEEFDEETEQLILHEFGDTNKHLEAYELAMMGEAETIVNMQQPAQEDATQDLFHKGIEQRRQVLEGCVADLAAGAAPVAAPRAMAAAGSKAGPRVRKAARARKPAKKKTRPAKKTARKKKPAARRKKSAPRTAKKRSKRR